MVVRTVRRLSEVCGGPKFVAASAQQDLPPLPQAVQVLRDRAPRRGPLEGIALATQAASAIPSVKAVAVVGCDFPRLKSALVSALFDVLAGEADVICVQDEDRLHPLLAVYRPNVWQVAEARRAAGQRSLHGLLGELRTQTVDLDFVRAVDPQLRSLINVNTPEDYQGALRMRE